MTFDDSTGRPHAVPHVRRVVVLQEEAHRRGAERTERLVVAHVEERIADPGRRSIGDPRADRELEQRALARPLVVERVDLVLSLRDRGHEELWRKPVNFWPIGS